MPRIDSHRSAKARGGVLAPGRSLTMNRATEERDSSTRVYPRPDAQPLPDAVARCRQENLCRFKLSAALM